MLKKNPYWDESGHICCQENTGFKKLWSDNEDETKIVSICFSDNFSFIGFKDFGSKIILTLHFSKRPNIIDFECDTIVITIAIDFLGTIIQHSFILKWLLDQKIEKLFYSFL